MLASSSDGLSRSWLFITERYAPGPPAVQWMPTLLSLLLSRVSAACPGDYVLAKDRGPGRLTWLLAGERPSAAVVNDRD